MVVDRGKCSFETKAAWASSAGASTLVVVNTEEGLFRMPPGMESFKPGMDPAPRIPGIMMKADDGAALKKLVARYNSGDSSETLEATAVAYKSKDHKQYRVGQCLTRAVEVDADGNAVASGGSKLTDVELQGGVLHLSGDGAPEDMEEYLAALFGGPTPKAAAELGAAEPVEACQPLTNGEAVKGKFVVVKRGGCMFAEKSKNVEAAGGFATIVANTGPILNRMFG